MSIFERLVSFLSSSDDDMDDLLPESPKPINKDIVMSVLGVLSEQRAEEPHHIRAHFHYISDALRMYDHLDYTGIGTVKSGQEVPLDQIDPDISAAVFDALNDFFDYKAWDSVSQFNTACRAVPDEIRALTFDDHNQTPGLIIYEQRRQLKEYIAAAMAAENVVSIDEAHHGDVQSDAQDITHGEQSVIAQLG